MEYRNLLLSIQPSYAQKIFDGSKTIELRRVKPNLSTDDYVIVYVTSPIKQVWGTFRVDGIIYESVEELWEIVKHDAGVTKMEFDAYFNGASYGYGIKIKGIPSLKKPIDLHVIQSSWKNFNPPQSYRYLSDREFNLLYSIS